LQPDPVQACAAQTSCLDVSFSSVAKARLGLCYPSCQVLGTDVCAPDALGNARGCDPFFDGGTGGYCWSRLPSAGAPGAPCQIPTDPDLRDTCGDRLYCSAVASYTCQGFCSTSSCPNSGSTCASCRPSPERCKSGAGPVGVCAP
jgi:hypothetical protein